MAGSGELPAAVVGARHAAAIRAAGASFDYRPLMAAVTTGPRNLQIVALNDLLEADAGIRPTGRTLLRKREHQLCGFCHEQRRERSRPGEWRRWHSYALGGRRQVSEIPRICR
jgi:hypothetical protein